ncbi:MAG: hypothetical protein ACR2KO_09330 [Geodermatophilaceae bacterium]|nr:hypothetical protein [Geodermatophilaceae bacterium]
MLLAVVEGLVLPGGVVAGAAELVAVGGTELPAGCAVDGPVVTGGGGGADGRLGLDVGGGGGLGGVDDVGRGGGGGGGTRLTGGGMPGRAVSPNAHPSVAPSTGRVLAAP